MSKVMMKVSLGVLFLGILLFSGIILAAGGDDSGFSPGPANLKFIIESGNPVVFKSLSSMKLSASQWSIMFQSVSSMGSPLDLITKLNSMKSCNESEIMYMLGISASCGVDQLYGLTMSEYMVYLETIKYRELDPSSLQSLSSAMVSDLSTPFESCWKAYEHNVRLMASCEAVESSISSMEACSLPLEEVADSAKAKFYGEAGNTAEFINSVESRAVNSFSKKVEFLTKEAISFGMALVDKEVESHDKGKYSSRSYYPKGKNKGTEV
nr:hypothetical protein [Donax semistriatus]